MTAICIYSAKISPYPTYHTRICVQHIHIAHAAQTRYVPTATIYNDNPIRAREKQRKNRAKNSRTENWSHISDVRVCCCQQFIVSKPNIVFVIIWIHFFFIYSLSSLMVNENREGKNTDSVSSPPYRYGRRNQWREIFRKKNADCVLTVYLLRNTSWKPVLKLSSKSHMIDFHLRIRFENINWGLFSGRRRKIREIFTRKYELFRSRIRAMCLLLVGTVGCFLYR